MTRAAHEAKKKKQQRHFSDYIVAVSISAIALYTLAAVILQFCGFAEVSATLTTCWFSFWTAEIMALAAIKSGKVKHGEQKDDNNETVEHDSS